MSCARTGSITGLYTVLVEGSDLEEPIADEVRGILDGHVVVVTGGGSGMGAAFARRLASDGAHVVVNDVNEAGAGAVAEEVGGETAVFDVTVKELKAAVPVVVDEDILTAHLLAHAGERGVEIVEDVDIVRVVDAHLAYFAAIGAVGPHAEAV